MVLPQTIRPEYATTIPSTGKKIKYQPFTVKEEKVLVLAAESKDPDEIINAVTNILKLCITSPDVKIEDLAIFDIEYLFLQCRMKSAGESIKLTLSDPDDESFKIDYEILLDKIQVEKDPNHKALIQIDKETTVKMNYPDITSFVDGINVSNIESLTTNTKKCISQIIVGEEVYNRVDMSDAEIDQWIEGLTQVQYMKFVEFFNTMPKLKHVITAKNTNTDKMFTVTLQGLSDFF